MRHVRAFTLVYPYRSLTLKSTVSVTGNGRTIDVPALWDTGATQTCISSRIAEALELPVRGTSTAITPSGKGLFSSYLIDIELPNGIVVSGMRVMGTEIHRQGLGVLIGMDVISQGDFAVSCKDGKTQFTFRMPSIEDANYVPPPDDAQAVGVRADQIG